MGLTSSSVSSLSVSERPVDGSRLYTRAQRWTYVTVGAGLAVALVLRTLTGSAGAMALAALQGALVLAATTLGPGAMHVRVDDNGVVVRNLLRTHRVRWSDVRGFTLDDRFPYRAYLDVADGREIPLLAITDEPWMAVGKGHDRNIDMLEALNGRWRREVVGAAS